MKWVTTSWTHSRIRGHRTDLLDEDRFQDWKWNFGIDEMILAIITQNSHTKNINKGDTSDIFGFSVIEGI